MQRRFHTNVDGNCSVTLTVNGTQNETTTRQLRDSKREQSETVRDPQARPEQLSQQGNQANKQAEDQPMRNDSPVLIEQHNGILIITINRPNVRNAVNRAVALGIAAGLDELDQNPSISVGILTGAGGTFCSGMDLKAFVTGERPEIEGRGLVGLTETPPKKPLIAAVEGFALAGGCEIVLACDLVVAAQDAKFGIPEVTRGLVAGSGGLIRLPQKIPAQIALEYALTGEHFSATDARSWGLVNRLSAPGQALAGAIELAQTILRNGPLGVQMTKRIINESKAWPVEEVWDRQRGLVESVLATEDAREGALAFAEKRPPKWRGR
jgi:enoyl-CoA hydratase